MSGKVLPSMPASSQFLMHDPLQALQHPVAVLLLPDYKILPAIPCCSQCPLLKEVHCPEQLVAVILLFGSCSVPCVERRCCRAVLKVADGRRQLLASQLIVVGKFMPSSES